MLEKDVQLALNESSYLNQMFDTDGGNMQTDETKHLLANS